MDARLITTTTTQTQTLAGRTEPSRPPSSVQQALAVASKYRQRDSSKTWLAILADYVVIACSISISRLAYNSSSIPTTVAILAHACAYLLIASRLRGFENLLHEASHGNLFSNVREHDQYQFLYAFPVWRTLEDYRSSHMRHHHKLGDPKDDPDVQRIQYLGLDHISERPVWYLVGLPLTGFLTLEYLLTVVWEFITSPASRFSKIIYCLSLSLLVYSTNSFSILLNYYLVPLLLVLPTTRYWAEAAEHVGTDMTVSFGSSRNNIGFWQQWLLHPHNDGFHALHHLHSQVPFYLLPDAHERLMEEVGEYKSKTVNSTGVLETFRQMTINPTTFKT